MRSMPTGRAGSVQRYPSISMIASRCLARERATYRLASRCASSFVGASMICHWST
jgi:hypothetical protein